MANAKHLDILHRGVAAWNAWRMETNETPDLTGADFLFSDLTGVNLSFADLTFSKFERVSFMNASLHETRLIGANLEGSMLQRADCRRANFSSANLRNAILVDANLSGAEFFNADLMFASIQRTDFTKCRFGFTILGATDLSRALGLETTIHIYPSTIGVDTLVHSQGKIPIEFLRGCGLPDEFIKLASTMSPKLASCFISYSHKDEEFAQILYSKLQNSGVRVWYAPKDIVPGKKLHEQIGQGIRDHDRLLLILSSHSMNSEWVKTEIANARSREAKEGVQMLFPIALVPHEDIRGWECFDADRGKDSAREVREYYIPDFSNWETDTSTFEREFEKLLRGLKL